MPRLAALQTLLARADQQVGTAKPYHACVADQFELQHDADSIAVAAVSHYADSGRKDDKVWMHVDPVYMEADKDRLVIRGSDVLELQRSEVDALQQELNNLYADDGYRFEAYAGNRWYMCLQQRPKSRFHAMDEVLGRSVEPFLPQGADQTHWHRFMNEVQMLLHASAVNQQRVGQDQFPVNSIWCWGPGKMPEQVRGHWHAVFSDEPFVKGLALLAGTTVHSMPASAEALLDKAAVTDKSSEVHALVVIEQSEEDMLSLDSHYHIDKLSKLENNWFAPLLRALRQRRIASVSLLPCNGVTYKLKKNHLWRFWRMRRSRI